MSTTSASIALHRPPNPSASPARREDARPVKVVLFDDDPTRAGCLQALLVADPTIDRVDLVGSPRAEADPLAECDAVVTRQCVAGVSAESLVAMLRAAGLERPVVVVSDGMGEQSAIGLMRAGASDVVGLHELEQLPAILADHHHRDVERGREPQAQHSTAGQGDLLSAVIDGTPNPVSIKHPDGRYLFVNRAFEEKFAVPRAEVMGRRDEEIFSDEQIVRALSQCDGQPLDAASPVTREHVIRGDGADWYLRTTKYPVAAADGRPAICTVLLDVTGHISEQRERAKLEAQLHQTQKLESLGHLAGGIAHDFNNLLSAIVHYNRFAAEAVVAALGTESRVAEDLEKVRYAAERATRLTDQLRSFSRHEVMRPETFDLGIVVAELSDLLRPIVGEQIELITSGASGLWPVTADRGKIEQVLVNLVVNGRDAMPTGGRLLIDTANAVIDQTFSSRKVDLEPGRYVRLAVSDTGVGMADDVSARAFEPFFTTKAKGQGTGLGLATVYGIVGQAGGHVEIYSELGVGTTVRVYLPAAEASAESYDPGDERPLGSGDETILLVEDDDAVRELTARILEPRGYRVIAAASGAEALQLIEASPDPIHLLLTDVVMPGMVGRELAERVMTRFPAVRVLYMSGYAENLISNEGRLPPDVALIEKPFSVMALTTRVREVLDA